MKRSPLDRRTALQRATPTPGSYRPARQREGRDGRQRPQAEHLAGSRPAGNPIPPENRAAVRDRSGGVCEIGGPGCTFRATEQHHRKRRRDGGHAITNLLDGCPPCHAHAHRNPAEARLRGWIVSAFEVDPAAVPILGDGRRFWLNADGTKTTDLSPWCD